MDGRRWPLRDLSDPQGALVRALFGEGWAAAAAGALIQALTRHRRHAFRPDDIGYPDVDPSRLLGHRQVTDAYLAGLARHHRARIATFDRDPAERAPDVATLISVW